MNLKKNLIWHP